MSEKQITSTVPYFVFSLFNNKHGILNALPVLIYFRQKIILKKALSKIIKSGLKASLICQTCFLSLNSQKHQQRCQTQFRENPIQSVISIQTIFKT